MCFPNDLATFVCFLEIQLIGVSPIYHVARLPFSISSVSLPVCITALIIIKLNLTSLIPRVFVHDRYLNILFMAHVCTSFGFETYCDNLFTTYDMSFRVNNRYCSDPSICQYLLGSSIMFSVEYKSMLVAMCSVEVGLRLSKLLFFQQINKV